MPATVAFVTAPADTPTITLALSGATSTVSVDGFTLGAPTFEGNPHSVGAEYGERTANFNIVVSGTYTAASTVMQAVARQLLLDRNWLMVNWGDPSSKPMFLRTYRTGQDALSWESSGAGIWVLPVTLICDPFIYGAPVTVGPVTITNNPASGTNPAWYKFATVLGDAPTGLKVSVVPSVSWQDYAPLMATTAYDTALENPSDPLYWQTNGFSLGAATTAVTGAGATYSAGNHLLFTPTGNGVNPISRFSGVAPTTIVPGTYKVLIRIARSDTTSTFALRLGQETAGVGTVYAYGDTVRMEHGVSTAAPYHTWVDLGDFAMPIGAGGVDYADIGALVAPNIDMQAIRLTGTGTIMFDAFYLIPVETASTVETAVARTVFVGEGLKSTVTGVWDNTRLPPQFRAYKNGALNTLTPPRVDGRYLRLVPGATNVFHLLQQTRIDTRVSTVNDSDTLTATASVTFEYYPKYLHARPDTT